MRLIRSLALTGILGLAALPVTAQFRQYTPPGSLVDRPDGKKDNLEAAVVDARWRLGPVRVHPWIGLRDLSFVDNIFVGQDADPTSDLTATLGAGLRAYLRTGPKVIWVAHALPEYVWWQDLDDRRQSTGRYGLGSFAFFNRLTLEATITQAEGQSIISPEFEQLLTNRRDEAFLSFDVEASRSFSVFGALSIVDIENLLEDTPGLPRLDRLDREETVLRGGVRYHFGDDLSLAIGVESSNVDFDQAEIALSNSGLSPLFGITWERASFFFEGEFVLRDLEAEDAAAFVSYDEPTGSVQLGLNTQADVRYHLYLSRNVVYSILAGAAYFEEQRVGGGITWTPGWRTSLRAYFESGTNDYTFADPLQPARRDDVAAFGGTLAFEIDRGASLVVQIAQTDYSSNLEGFDRDATFIRAGINFGGGVSPWW